MNAKDLKDLIQDVLHNPDSNADDVHGGEADAGRRGRADGYP